jgi:inosine/xanthosine triphosphate pyrophosphatase family protein
MKKKKIRYATKSAFKREEVRQLLSMPIRDPQGGNMVTSSDLFEVEFYDVQLAEPLERDITVMVRHKVMSAYRGVMAPVVVEHAGLVLEGYEKENYPGGLTQPIWDAMTAENFAKSMMWAGTRAIARALVGYCDGMKIHCFDGETSGTLVDTPRGDRHFYWDTIFCPDGGGDLTYAEIAASNLPRKVELSQSTKAMRKLFDHLLKETNRMFAEY